MGRFVRESVSVDPETSIVFQTEDQTDGLLYRFIPHEFGKLSIGGRLQCLAVRDRPKFDTRNWRQQNVSKGYRLPVLWIDLEETDSERSSLRKRGLEKGAALFASGEGMLFDRKAVTFACTNGGPSGKGQIWRYTLSPSEGKIEEEEVPGVLELIVEPNDEKILKHPDQIHMTPWGDMFVCEDGEGVQSIVGVTPQGKFYKFAQNSVNDSEFTGVCFSPDGRTMFVNIQESGLTLVISGPWPSALK